MRPVICVLELQDLPEPIAYRFVKAKNLRLLKPSNLKMLAAIDYCERAGIIHSPGVYKIVIKKNGRYDIYQGGLNSQE